MLIRGEIDFNALHSPPMDYGSRFKTALQKIDLANAQDPRLIQFENESHPAELLYSQWLTDWVLRLQPDASEPLLLAARSQHICRWMSPRDSYEMTRAGYLKWRADLKKFHAEKSGEILAETGYPADLIARVQSLNLKLNLADDPECQTLEDALCLVTLQYQLSELMRKSEEEKLIEIVRKTWKKMSTQAREAALTLPFPQDQADLIKKALS